MMKKQKHTTGPEKQGFPLHFNAELDVANGAIIKSTEVIHFGRELETEPQLPQIVPATTASDIISMQSECMVWQD